MRIRFSFALFLSLVLASSLAIAQSRTRGRTPSDDWMADASDTDSVVLQLDSDQNGYNRTIDAQTLVALLKSSTITDPAIEKAMGTSGAEARKFVIIDAQMTGNRFFQLAVAVKAGAPNVKPGVAKIITADLCDRLRAVVDQSAKAATAGSEARRASLETDLTAATEHWKKAQSDLKAARVQNPDVNGNNPRYNYQNLVQQKQQTELQLATAKARLKALTESQPTTAPANPSGPPTLQSPVFSKLIELRQKKLDDVKSAHEKGVTSAGDITDAELALAEARAMADAFATLAVRQQQPYQNYPMNDLVSLRASVAENEARLAALNDQLAQLKPVGNNQPETTMSQEEMMRLQTDEQRARSEVDMIQNQLSELKRNNRIGTPTTLTVLDGKSKV